MEFKTGKDYPHLCERCKAGIDECAEEITVRMSLGVGGIARLAFKDSEAPVMLAYDRGLLCDNGICKGEESLFATPSMA